MYQPANMMFGARGPWYRNNIRVAGMVVAGQCVLGIVIFGFGLLLMGALSMAASTAFEPKANDPEIFRNHPNVPKLIGTIFLSIGGVLFVIGLILMIYVIQKARNEMQQTNTQPGQVLNSTYPQPQNQYGPSTMYPPPPGQQPAAYPMNPQPYPPPGSEQSQPFISGQPYPTVPGQHGQPYQSGTTGQPMYPDGTNGGTPYPPSSGPMGNVQSQPGAPPPPYFDTKY